MFAAGSNAHIDFATLRYSGAGNVAAFQAPAYTVPVIGNNVTLTSNWGNAIELPGGQPPTNNTELKSYGAPYLVISSITVPAGATFTIDPGAILKFWFGTGIVANGSLSATGTGGAPIYFTSVRDALVGGNTVPSQGTSPQPSDWSNLVFAAGSSAQIDFATLRYSGAGNVAAFQAPAYTVPVIGNNVTLTSNWGNAIELPGGQPPTNTELKSYGAPYLVISTLTVPLGATFTIDPGAILKFWFGTGMVVDGTLSAAGTSGLPIEVTSVRDAQIGGNTVPSQGTSPAAGDWTTISVLANGSASLSSALVRYGGNGALSLASGSLTVTQSCLTNNSVGLLATSPGASITNSWIYNNSNFGVQGSLAAPVSATSNWWGSKSGPFNSVSNPNGTGNPVSAGVTFVPYVTSPTTCAFHLPLPPCTPRPQIALAVTPNGHNGLQISVTDMGQNVLLKSVQFGATLNGLIDMPPTLVGSVGNVTVPLGGVGQTNFTIRQQIPGAAVTVPFTIVDQCGAWPTFVGGGPAAFASTARARTEAVVVVPRPGATAGSGSGEAGTGTSDGDRSRPTSRTVVGSSANHGGANSAAPIGVPGLRRVLPTSQNSVTAVTPLTPQTTGQAASPTPAPAGNATGTLSGTTIDPALGVATPTGDAALTIPSGARSDSAQFTLADVTPAPTDLPPTTPDKALGTTLVEIVAQDGSGGAVVSFDVPVTITVTPDATDLQTVGGDPTALALATSDSASGSWQILPTDVNSDGSLSAEVTAPGLLTILKPSAVPAADGNAPAD